MNARRWIARRIGNGLRVRCTHGLLTLMAFRLTDEEAEELITQLEVARHVPPPLSEPPPLKSVSSNQP